MIAPMAMPATRPSHTGLPSMISQPQTQPDSAATPGMDRSRVPQMMPTATPAAKIALSAAALATSLALFVVKKKGLHQTAKPRIKHAPQDEDPSVPDEDQQPRAC